MISDRSSRECRSFSGCVSTGREWSSRIRTSSGHISARWFVRRVTKESTWSLAQRADCGEFEKDTQHTVLRLVKGRFITMANEKILMVLMSVTDMAKAKAFYAEQLGWTVTTDYG